jgi:hypothetical protein
MRQVLFTFGQITMMMHSIAYSTSCQYSQLKIIMLLSLDSDGSSSVQDTSIERSAIP